MTWTRGGTGFDAGRDLARLEAYVQPAGRLRQPNR